MVLNSSCSWLSFYKVDVFDNMSPTICSSKANYSSISQLALMKLSNAYWSWRDALFSFERKVPVPEEFALFDLEPFSFLIWVFFDVTEIISLKMFLNCVEFKDPPWF